MEKLQIGNILHLDGLPHTDKKIFKITSLQEFLRFVSDIAARLRAGQKIGIEVLTDEKRKLAEIRAAYFCWVRQKTNEAAHDGASVDDLHERYKATYLIKILTARNLEFADLFHKMIAGGVTEDVVLKLLSVADSSITTSEIMREYFTACQRGGWDKGSE